MQTINKPRVGGETGKARSPSMLVLIGLSTIELVIALGLWAGLVVGGYWLGCRFMSCHDLQGLQSYMIALPVAVVGAIAFWIAAVRMGRRLRQRLILDAAAVLIAIVSYAGAHLARHLA